MTNITAKEFIRKALNLEELKNFNVSEHIEIDTMSIKQFRIENCTLDRLSIRHNISTEVDSVKPINRLSVEIVKSKISILESQDVDYHKFAIHGSAVSNLDVLGGRINRVSFRNNEMDRCNLAEISFVGLSIEGCTISSAIIHGGDAETRFKDATVRISRCTGASPNSSLDIGQLVLSSAYLIGMTNLSVNLWLIEAQNMALDNFVNSNAYISSSSGGGINIDHWRNGALSLDSLSNKVTRIRSGEFACISLTGLWSSKLEAQPSSRNSNAPNRIDVDKIELSNLLINSEGAIEFNSLIKIDRLDIRKFSNKGLFQINSCSIVTGVTMAMSNLGNSIFNSVTIMRECLVVLEDCYLSQIILSNVRWENGFLINNDIIWKDYNGRIAHFSGARESYRQLKLSYQSQGNYIDAMEFKIRELGMHYNVLKLTARRNWKEIPNFLILWTHKHASDFGSNIIKPIVFLFLFHLILFNLLLYFVDMGISISLSPNINATKWACQLYFETLLPTHDFQLTALNGDVILIAGFTDFLMRIFSGFFIYYFIVASRKYHF